MFVCFDCFVLCFGVFVFSDFVFECCSCSVFLLICVRASVFLLMVVSGLSWRWRGAWVGGMGGVGVVVGWGGGVGW